MGGLVGLPLLVNDAVALQATPEGSPAAVSDYPVLDDPRELFVRPWNLEGRRFSISGTITQLNIAPPGSGFDLEEQTGQKLRFRCVFTMEVELPESSADRLIVGFDEDPEGAYQGDRVTVLGALIGKYEAINDRGVDTVWPFVRADQVIVENADRRWLNA
jgi:hypothetical protein